MRVSQKIVSLFRPLELCAALLLGSTACSGAGEADEGGSEGDGDSLGGDGDSDTSDGSGGVSGDGDGDATGITGGASVGVGLEPSPTTGGAGTEATGGDTSETGGSGPALPEFCDSLRTAPEAGDWQTSRVYYEEDRLVYVADAEQNRIADFSYAGYHYGEVPLPDVYVIETLGPIDGDDTNHIQAALDRVGARERDANGFRGAVVLGPGSYQIGGQILLNQSGVVLRGSGQGSDPTTNTILQITGTGTRTAVRLGSGNGTPWSQGASTAITTPFVQVGSTSFDVASASGLTVGDEIIVRHPSSQAWINAVNGGGTATDPNWTAGTKDLTWIRRIRGISGNTLTLDAPIYYHLNASLTTSTVYLMTNKQYRTEIGLENLRVNIATNDNPEDEAHARDAVGIVGVEDAWVRDVTVLHFTHAGFYTQGAVRITVSGSTAIEPVGIRTGERFYNLDAESNSQLVLYTNCEAHDGRHNMIVNGTGFASGIVFHRIDSRGNSSQSEGHRHFSHGMLFDTIYGTTAGQVQLISRGDWGTEHGWSSVHSVIWNNTGVSRIQKPPTAQNYAFSSVGSLSTTYPFAATGVTGENDIRSTGDLLPRSLYEAQLCERFWEGRLIADVVGLPPAP